MVYTLDKFRTYLVGSDIVIFIDHSTLKYILTKQDGKGRLIRRVLRLQEFKLQIKDEKGVENVVADHFSRLTIAHNTNIPPINDEFLEKSLFLVIHATELYWNQQYLYPRIPTVVAKLLQYSGLGWNSGMGFLHAK